MQISCSRCGVIFCAEEDKIPVSGAKIKCKKCQNVLTIVKGFTLIELMIVIAIIGILAAVAIPNFISYRNKAFCSHAETDGSSVLAALASYFSEPENTQLPSPGTLAEAGYLSVNNGTENVTYTGATANQGIEHGAEVWINVTDKSGRCPRGTEYHVAMGANEIGYWSEDP